MSDLIRRDDAMQAIADYEFPWCKDAEPVHLVYGMGTAMKIVEKIPAVDAVEVVRCRYCFRATQYDDGSDNYVCSLGGTRKGSDFCSDGERRKICYDYRPKG